MHRRDIYMIIYLSHLRAYVFMSLICSSMQCLAQFTQYAKNSHLNITAGSMVQVIISKGKQVNPKGAVSLHLRLIPSEFMQ